MPMALIFLIVLAFKEIRMFYFWIKKLHNMLILDSLTRFLRYEMASSLRFWHMSCTCLYKAFGAPRGHLLLKNISFFDLLKRKYYRPDT